MKFILKARWLILVGWVVLITVLMVTQPNMAALVRDKGVANVPDGYRSSEASHLLDEWQKQDGKGSSSSTALVFYNKDGLTKQDKNEIKHGIQELKDHQKALGITDITNVFDQPSLKQQLISKNNKTMLVSLNMTLGNKDSIQVTKKLYAAIKDVSVDHYYTSDWMINNDTMESTQNGLHKSEYLTIIFILVVLFVVFRSVVAPFVPLIAVGFSFMAAQAVVAFLVDWFNFPLSNFTQIFLVAVLFGIGTDYCILLINRFKEEIPQNETINEAVIKTIKNGGRTVFFSSLTVFIGFATIGFSTFNIYQSAVGVAVGIAFLILSLVTIVPILMSLLGTKLFWPMNNRISHSQSRLWGGMGRFALARPLISLVIVAIIVIPTLITYNGNRSFDSVGEMSEKYGSVKGYNIIANNFNPGEAMPTTIVLKNDENMDHRKYLETIEAITRSVEKVDHVDTVRSATQPTGKPIKDFLVPKQAQTLDKGIKQANDGVTKIADGLKDAHNQLKESQPKLKQATGSIDDLVSGTKSLQTGVVQLQNGLEKIEQGIDNGNANSQDIVGGLEQLKDSANTLLSKQKQLLNGYEQLQSGLNDISTNYHQVYTGVQQLNTISANLKAAIEQLNQLGKSDASLLQNPQYQKSLGILNGTEDGLDQLLNGQENKPGLLAGVKQMDSGLKTLNSKMKVANNGLSQLVQGQQQYNTGLQKIISSINQIEAGLQKATGNIPKITNGFDQVIDGQSQLKQGFSNLDQQMSQLTNGLGDSADGLHKISGGLDDAGDYLKELSANNSSLSGFYIPNQALNNKDFTKSLDTYMSKDRKITKLDVILDVNPYSQTALNEIDNINNAVKTAIKDTPMENVKIGIGGPTSTFHDLSNISDHDYNRTVKWMLVGIGIILILLLRSFIMPVYIIGSLIVTYYTSLGISEKIFEDVLGYAGVNWAIPFFGFVMLVALCVDYSIFLMDRFNEQKDLPVGDALLDAMKNMGSVILSAAIILGGTFAAMIPSGVTELIEIATIILAGLIIYNLFMLPLFIPVMVRIFGNANWWPFKRGE
ncbi:MMPL family transporter [Heyndrickxia ginsengihumi]|uniref:MMPL family transporter n=1 Tax=Heyndrickxia ginsengihumi TaxID=363870 RepID=UPI003D1FF3F8